MKSPTLLKTVFAVKGNFAPGITCETKSFSGVEIAPFKHNARAAVCISADFEMSWAWRGNDQETPGERAGRERHNLPFILRLLEEYSIPITWATVGHLFLESCERSRSGLAHACMPRPPVNDRWTGDWYIHDPCSDVRTDPLWYAPDLVQRIIDCKVPQEIGTHSFSHINFSSRCSTPELVNRELEACCEAMQPFGVKPRSLVFPHNIMEYSYLQLFADAGVTAVRHRDAKVRLSYPERTPWGVYKIYESMNLRTAKHYDYLDKARIFIEKAMERRAAYSLWFHPSDPIQIFDRHLRAILRYVDSERKNGRLWVTTMGDIAAYCEARERVRIAMQRESNKLVLFIHSSLDVARHGAPEITLLIPGPSTPRSASMELVNGDQVAVDVHPVQEASTSRFMVNIPANAKCLQLAL